MARPPAQPGLVRVDLLAFTLGLTSYAELVGIKAEGASPEVLKSGGAQCIRADVVTAMTSLLSEMQQAISGDAAPPAILLTVFQRAESMRGVKKFLYFGENLPRLLNWFQSHTDSFRDVLSGSASTSIPSLLKLGDMGDARQRLKALGEFEFRSTLRVLRRWLLEEALPSLSLQPIGVKATAADIAAAQPYVEELRSVQQQLANMDPGSEDAAELTEQKVEIQAELDAVVGESSNPQAVETVVGQQLASEDNALAKLAQKYRLDEDQATVVAEMGNCVVSAGAGSGKTTTLIAVVQDSLERGYRPDQILGTTFTTKASEEFNDRLTAKGVGGVRFGTSHSIAREIMMSIQPSLGPWLDDPDKRAGKLFEMAVAQVEMEPRSATAPPNLEEPPVVPDPEDADTDLVAQQLERARLALEKHDWSDALKNMIFWLKKPNARPLTERELSVLEKMERTPRGGFSRGRRRTAEAETELDFMPMFGDEIVRTANQGEKTRYWNEPANQWWNLGLAVETPIRSLRTQIGFWANNAVSWQVAWKKYGMGTPSSPEEAAEYEKMYEAAAVYAAYSWLKKNDPQYGPVLDFDDWMGKAVELLKRKPKALERFQSRYKVVIVDEAQDLNAQQWDLFGMLAAKADRYMLVGDDFQCVESETPINTPAGFTRAKDLREGDMVLANVNGEASPRRVLKAWKTAWTHGVRITTAGGRTLTMSPNHKLWASPLPFLEEGQAIVYLMWRRGFGFRVGMTHSGWDAPNRYGGRPMQEGADKMWVLDRCDSEEEALLKEVSYSLQYGIPTIVYNGQGRGVDQERVATLFRAFGSNGSKLLEEKHLSFDLPHWMSSSYDKHSIQRRTIRLNGQSAKGSQVTLEWSGNDLDASLAGVNFVKQADGRNRLRKYTASYVEAEQFAQDLHRRLPDSLLDYRLSTPDGMYRLTTASGLHLGMKVPVLDKHEGLDVEEITHIEWVPGTFVDLEVEDASNFFGDGILSHNSIYRFRGANTAQFIDKPLQGFKLLQMGMNYRSGRNIVETANALIAVNEHQIKKVCRAARANGEGTIEGRIVPDHEVAAQMTAQSIVSQIEAGAKPSDFGIVVRNNAEMDAYCLELMIKQVPFICPRDPLSGAAQRSLLAWATLGVGLEAGREAVNDAITVAHQNPGFFLDAAFAEGLRRGVQPGGNQLDTLLSGYEPYVGTQRRRNENVRAYADAIRSIQGYATSTDLLKAILAIRGQKGTSFLDVLVKDVDLEDVDPSLEGEEKHQAVLDAAQVPLRPLFGIAEAVPNPADFMAFIAKLRRAKELAKKGDRDREPAVRIGTAHSWKGLEAQNMFVEMADGVFPSSYATSPEDMEEERRLAYVAVTRGKQSVTVFSPLISYRGPKRSPHRGLPPPPPQPSVFMEELARGGCMPVHGRQLISGPERDMDLEDENGDGEESNRFANRVASEEVSRDSLDPHSRLLV